MGHCEGMTADTSRDTMHEIVVRFSIDLGGLALRRADESEQHYRGRIAGHVESMQVLQKITADLEGTCPATTV